MKSKAILLLLLQLSQSIAFNLVFNDDGEKLTVVSTPGITTVSLYEEMDVDIRLATLTYTGTSELALLFSSPNVNANDNLGLRIIKSETEADTFYLDITLRQNYESSYFDGIDKAYIFQIVALGSDDSERIRIALVNINDNAPVIRVNDASCPIEENNPDKTNCSITITDEDGDVDNIQLSLSDSMSDTFKFVEESITVDRKEITLFLQPKIELDYETVMLYVVDLIATDKPLVPSDEPLSTTAKVVVQVIDLPDMKPVWVTIFASQQFEELTPQTFFVQARDGDLGVDDDVTYSKDSRWDNYITIDEVTGRIDVKGIDRDYDRIQIYEFTISACEVKMPDECIDQDITFLVDDTNNQKPVITTNTTIIEIEENFYKDLPLVLSANDLDMGDNALYSVTLIGEQSTAFTIAPSTGYQETNLYLYVTNFTLLDYEEEKWRSFQLTIKTDDNPNIDSVTITFTLTNLNDEIPIFRNMETETGYTVAIEETIGPNEEIKVVLAEDKDEGDKVHYELLGTYINNILNIDEENGQITTRVDRALDFETQEEVILQVMAIDTLMEPFNTAIAQVTIIVVDVNDETPRIIVGNQRIEVPENLEENLVIVNSNSNYLIATDDDQTADLVFTIDWDTSYATKTGQRVDSVFEQYKEFITIKTVPIDSSGSTKGKSVAAVLEIEIIQEIPNVQTPDFEMFEIVYLSIVVEDKNQTYGEKSNSVTVPIYVIDKDDEPPQFVESTITSAKHVVEESQVGTVIGVVIATDVDSVDITYEITSENSDYAELVTINSLGEISVAANIDADIPIYSMTFQVTASDGHRDTTREITITVTDINDNDPIFENPLSGEQFTVYEQIENGKIIIEKLEATDKDRDAPNNIITYSLSSNELFNPTLRSYFGVVDSSFRVSYADENNKLDRDSETPGINNTIYLVARDLGDTPRSGEVSFYVIVLDINNKSPELITQQINNKDESLLKDELIGQIVAHDGDEAGTANTRINFEILSITPLSGKEIPPNIFYLDNPNPDAGTVNLKTSIDLEGYYGTYTLEIKTEDEGINPGPLSSIGHITVEISKYNFKDPLFTNPLDGDKFFLATLQDTNSRLQLYNGEPLPDFTATDQQGNKYQLRVSIILDESGLFAIQTGSSTTSQLQMTSNSMVANQTYTISLQVEAVDANPTRTTSITITVQFVDQYAEPVFTETTQTISFAENITEPQFKMFHNAYFQNLPEELDFPVYYIITSNSPEFEIENIIKNEISVITQLDREEQPSYEVRVVSSRLETGVAVPGSESILTLTILVTDVNDNPPNFVTKTFFGSISSTTTIGSAIMTIAATDLDENPVLKYSIEGYETTPPSISSSQPFSINEDTGVISSTVTILDNADGYFLFNVKVNDGEFSDFANVNIYIVSDIHRVEFLFANDVTSVDALQNQIILVLEAQFNYTCIIEQVLQSTDDSGNPIENETIVRIHFVNSEINTPVLKTEIEATANNIQIFASLTTQFERHQLTLLSFLNNSSDEENMENVFRAWLIGVTVVMSTLCILLLVAFILKTRSLTQRLNKLSVIRYGSQESVSNRRAAPFTNKHATEGSNPAYSEDKIKSPEGEDAISVGSGDSDLVGVENNPEFDYKYEKQENSTK